MIVWLPSIKRPACNGAMIRRHFVPLRGTQSLRGPALRGFPRYCPYNNFIIWRAPLTFSHRSGVAPYTSSCELAGSCVFGKQSPEILLLQPKPMLRSGSSKSQAPNYKQYLITKILNSKRFEFENWNFKFVCDLGFVIWNSQCEALVGQALSRTYGRFFAEFLNEESLVPLRLLASPTCVGLRYDF